MTTSVEKLSKRSEFKTKFVLDGKPTNVTIDVVEEIGKFYVQCLVDSGNFDGVEVLDQIHSWASLFGLELPLEHIAIYYQDPAQTRDIMNDTSDMNLDNLIDELYTD